MTQTRKTQNHHWFSAGLIALTLSITLAMGCTDMQTKDSTGGKLAGQKFTLSNPRITINGHTYPHFDSQEAPSLEFPASGITYIRTSDYGAFLISGHSFDGAKSSGTLSGHHLRFTINNRSLDIYSRSEISPFKMTVWVKNVPLPSAKKGNYVEMGWAGDLDALHKKDAARAKWRKALQDQLQDTVNLDVFNDQLAAASDFGHYTVENGKKVYPVGDKIASLMSGIQSVQDRIQYPEAARKAGIEGQVYVGFALDKYGNVTDAHVIKGIGYGCDQAALHAVEQAVFEPVIKDGKPVKVLYSIPIVFKL